jgi:hypothetical protein
LSGHQVVAVSRSHTRQPKKQVTKNSFNNTTIPICLTLQHPPTRPPQRPHHAPTRPHRHSKRRPVPSTPSQKRPALTAQNPAESRKSTQINNPLSNPQTPPRPPTRPQRHYLNPNPSSPLLASKPSPHQVFSTPAAAP